MMGVNLSKGQIFRKTKSIHVGMDWTYNVVRKSAIAKLTMYTFTGTWRIFGLRSTKNMTRKLPTKPMVTMKNTSVAFVAISNAGLWFHIGTTQPKLIFDTLNVLTV